MEDNINDTAIEETSIDPEVEETDDGSGAALVMGFIGGFFAYVVIGGTKKLLKFAATKYEQHKAKKETATKVIDVDATVESDEDSEK